MNRSKLLRFSIGLANSLTPTCYSGLSELSLTQVTQFSQFNPNSFPTKPYICSNNPFNFHRKLFFSSKPEPFIDLVLSNDWSEEIEKKLENWNPKLTHESVVYVLVELDTNPRKSLDFFKWVCVKNGFRPSFSTFMMLLWTLACKGFMGEFWKVFSEMKKNGIYMNYKAYLHINEKLVSGELDKESVEWTKRNREMVELDTEKDVADTVLVLITSFDWDDIVKGLLMKKLKFPLTENFVLRILGELYEQEQPLKALRFFEWIGSCGGYGHDAITYNAMAQVLARDDSVDEFWDFVRQMRIEGYEIDSFTYTRSLKFLPVKDALEVFEIMVNRPYKHSKHHTSSLLIMLTRISGEFEADIDLIHRVFNKFVDAGNAPTKIIYDGVHRALCTLGRFDEAKKVVQDMRNLGYQPDNVTYSQEIFGLCKNVRLDEAGKVLERMEVEGCVPNVNTWTMLISCHCEANRMDLALSCFVKMKEKYINQYDILCVLLNGFLSENKVGVAYNFLTEFVKNGGHLRTTRDTCKLMIDKLVKAGKLEEALYVLSMMKEQHFRLYTQPITKYISKYGTVEDAKRLLNVLNPDVTSSPAVYKKVVKAFFEQHRYKDAKGLVLSSPAHVRENVDIQAMFVSDQVPHSDRTIVG